MATFYGTLAGALAYHAARGNAAWGASSDPLRTSALIRATTYIDATYRSAFPGLKINGRAQALEWPRGGAYDITGYGIPIDEVPAEVENATYEGALRELVSPGVLMADIEAGGPLIKREKVGPIETEYALAGASTKAFPAIDAAIAPLLGAPSPYSGAVARA